MPVQSITRSRVFRADALLLFLAILWGSGFIAQKWAMLHIGPMTFVTIRLLLGTAFLLPFLFLGKRSTPRVPTPWRALAPTLGLLIVLVFLGTWLQQAGLVSTEVGTAGFITGLYVVFTPLLGLLIGYRVRALTWVATIIAVIGLYLLTVAGRPVLNMGDLLILLCAIAWGGQLLIVGWLAPRMDTIKLVVIQLGGAAVISAILTPIFENPSISLILAAKWDLLYSGLLASGLAFLIQAFAQRDAPPAHAAILISLEAVFAVLFGWWLLDEQLDTIQFIGCGIMLLAILIAQIQPERQAFMPDLKKSVNLPPPEADQRSHGPA